MTAQNLEIFQNKAIGEIDYQINQIGRFNGQVDHDWEENGTDYGFTLIWKFNKLTGNFDELELIYNVDYSEKPYDFSEFDKSKVMDIERKERN